MSQRQYHKTDTQVCGDCMGEGKVIVQLEPPSHGSDIGSNKETVCLMCLGSGLVKVTRDVTITVAAHHPKGIRLIQDNKYQ